jgi:hypothetical protein
MGPTWNIMSDDLAQLRTDEKLRRLLDYYAEPGLIDREAWQDRVMELDTVSHADLVRMHGELLAHEWIEPNVGVLPALRAGTVPQCYRVTVAGLRALKRSRLPDDEDHAYSAAA